MRSVSLSRHWLPPGSSLALAVMLLPFLCARSVVIVFLVWVIRGPLGGSPAQCVSRYVAMLCRRRILSADHRESIALGAACSPRWLFTSDRRFCLITGWVAPPLCKLRRWIVRGVKKAVSRKHQLELADTNWSWGPRGFHVHAWSEPRMCLHHAHFLSCASVGPRLRRVPRASMATHQKREEGGFSRENLSGENLPKKSSDPKFARGGPHPSAVTLRAMSSALVRA